MRHWRALCRVVGHADDGAYVVVVGAECPHAALVKYAAVPGLSQTAPAGYYFHAHVVLDAESPDEFDLQPPFEFNHPPSTYKLITITLNPVEVREIAEQRAKDGPVKEIVLRTRVPEKWRFIDLETSEVWMHDGKTYYRAPDATYFSG